MALVSDAISAAGLGDGAFRVGTVDVTVEHGVSRLADGTLAGAVRPLAWGLRMLVELGVPIVAAVATLDGRDVTGEQDAILVNRFYLRGIEQIDRRTGVRAQTLPGGPLGGVSWQDRSR